MWHRGRFWGRGFYPRRGLWGRRFGFGWGPRFGMGLGCGGMALIGLLFLLMVTVVPHLRWLR